MSRRFAIPAQAESGAFISEVDMPSGVQIDENSFITALTCEALAPWKDEPGVAGAISGGLQFIKTCASRRVPGAFGFWPEGKHPKWLARPLPPDTDDTVLCHSILTLFDPAFELTADARPLISAIEPSKVLYLDERSRPWHRVGGFETWIDPAAIKNPVDLIVNVNVLVLLERTCELDAEVNSIRGMLEEGLAWAGRSKARARLLAPWYPEPIELLFALERAARLGVLELDEYIGFLRGLDWVLADLTSETVLPICGSDDRRFKWYCRGLDRLRRLAQKKDHGVWTGLA